MTFTLLRSLGQLDLMIALSYVLLLTTVGGLMFWEGLRAMMRARGGNPVPARRSGSHGWIHGLPLKLRFKRSKIYLSVIPVIAVGLLIPTLILFATSFRALGANYRGGVGLYPNHALVTTGPYRLIRHPIYLAFIAIMCLVFVLSANWLLGLSGLLLVGSIAIARIPIEERELHERFGMSWQTYQEQTGKFFPRVRR